MVARRAILLDRCDVCVGVPGRCQVGPEMKRGRFLNVVGPSIQLVEDSRRRPHRRFMVVVFVGGLKVNRVYPLGFYRNFAMALHGAFDRAKHLTGGPIEPWCDGDHMAGATPGRRVPIMITRADDR